MKKSLLSMILLLAMLISSLPMMTVHAAITPTKLSYTSGGTETVLGSIEGGIVPFSADSLKVYFLSSVSEVEAKLYYYAFDKEVMLPSDVSVSDNCVTIVPKERLEQGARHKIVFENAQDGATVSFIATKSKNDLLFFYDDFEGDTTKMSVQRYNAVIEQKSVSGNKMLHMYMPSGVNTAAYADAVSNAAEQESYIIIDAVINPVKIEGNGFVELFDSRNSGGTWRKGARMNSDGSISMFNSSGSLENIGTWQEGIPFRFTAVYDLEAGRCNVYIDNGFKKSVTVNKLKTCVFRIDINNQSGGDAEIYFDNLKIYSGTEIQPDTAFGNYDRYSTIDHSQSAKKAIGSAWVFTDAVYYFKDGEKLKYTSESQKPQIIDGKMYVSEGFITGILGKSTDSLKEVHINGESLYDAETLTSLTGREYLYDFRGFFILSESEFPYVNSHNFTTLFEESDYIYRYVYFDNPKSEEMLQDLRNNIGENTHPRLYYTTEDITYIKNKTKTDDIWLGMYNKAISNADSYLTKEITLTPDCIDANKQNQATSFQSIMESLSLAYLLTENAAYAEKGMEYMDVMCGWESMGYITSNLTTGHWSMGMAVGYDAFYNYMMQSDDGREKAAYYRQRVRELPFRDTLDALLGRQGREMSGGSYKNVHWINLCDNFQGVISGGLMALALSVADEADMYEDSMYMLENLTRTMEIAVSLYAPDGGYFESVGYSGYMLDNLTKGITALFNTCGTDYGFGNGKGFKEAGEYFVYMQTVENRLNFSDCARGASNTMIPAFFARYYGRTYAAEMTAQENKLRPTLYDAADMLNYLHYYKSLDLYGRADISNPETDRYYYAAEAGTFRNAFGTPVPTFAGFHGGTTNRKHDMLDTGEFVFEAGGIPWAVDIGSDNYNLPSYFATAGYKIYRKHTQGENCVLINPLTDPDNYFGQALGEEAPLISYVSKPKGAFAAFDMTNVYNRDVTSYKRGYYFGDNRNTLTVQDEITLKDTSELYWFMHTEADIEIVDEDTAKLTCDGEELLLEVYSNKPFTLASMDAVPLEGTPVIEGQNENEGITKVSLHFQDVSGDVNIAVKLIHQSEYFSADALSFIPIDSWSIDDGECEAMPVITDVYVDPFRKMNASVQIPNSAKSAYVLADGEVISEIKVPFGSVQKLGDVDISSMEKGIYRAGMKLIYEDGSEEIYEGDFFTISDFESKVFYSNNLAKEVTATAIPVGWHFSEMGTSLQNDDCITITKGNASYSALEFRASSTSYALYDEVIVMECDINFSSLGGTFNIECKNAEDTWFFNNYALFRNGIMYDGSKYEANKWYRIKLMINTKTGYCSFYVDDKVIVDDVYIKNATSNYVYKLQFMPTADSDAVSYKNFVVSRMVDAENISLTFSAGKGAVNTVLSIKDASLCEFTKMKLVVGTYSDKELKGIYMYDIDLNDESMNTETSIPVSGDITSVKGFLLDSNLLVPAIKSVCYSPEM